MGLPAPLVFSLWFQIVGQAVWDFYFPRPRPSKEEK